MNIRLVQAFIAKRVTMRHPELAFARENMNRDDYHQMVLEKEIGYFDPEVLKEAKAIVINRFSLEEHQMMRQNPTLRQWIADITCTWGKEDILAFFAEYSGFSVQEIQNLTLADCRVHIGLFFDHTDLLMHLEDITGKVLGDYTDEDPFAYLGNDKTYDEIAEFFSYKS